MLVPLLSGGWNWNLEVKKLREKNMGALRAHREGLFLPTRLASSRLATSHIFDLNLRWVQELGY